MLFPKRVESINTSLSILRYHGLELHCRADPKSIERTLVPPTARLTCELFHAPKRLDLKLKTSALDPATHPKVTLPKRDSPSGNIVARTCTLPTKTKPNREGKK